MLTLDSTNNPLLMIYNSKFFQVISMPSFKRDLYIFSFDLFIFSTHLIVLCQSLSIFFFFFLYAFPFFIHPIPNVFNQMVTSFRSDFKLPLRLVSKLKHNQYCCLQLAIVCNTMHIHVRWGFGHTNQLVCSSFVSI